MVAAWRRRAAELKEHVREFTALTSIHGVQFLGEPGRFLVERVFWVLVLLTSTTLCGLEVHKIYSRWVNSPVLVLFEEKPTHIAKIPFPAVTICPHNRVRLSVLDVGKNQDLFQQQLLDAQLFKDDSRQLLVEAMSMQCFSDPLNFTDTFQANFTPTAEHIQALKETITPQLEDFMSSCFYGATGVEHSCSSLFRPVMTSVGVCFTFNMLHDSDLFRSVTPVEDSSPAGWNLYEGYTNKNPEAYPRRPENYQGPSFGLRLTLHSRETQAACSMGDPHFHRVLLHKPNELPDTEYGAYLDVTPGKNTMMSLRPEVITAAPELSKDRYTPLVRGCNFEKDKELKTFKWYSQQNCEMECESATYREACGCQPPHLPLSDGERGLSYCPVTVDPACETLQEGLLGKKFFGDESDLENGKSVTAPCGCLPSCHDIEYHYSSHSTDLPAEVLQDGYSSFSKLNIFFGQRNFQAKRRSELYGVSDFLASCGGLLGLFSGFSFISAAEIVYFSSLRLACRALLAKARTN